MTPHDVECRVDYPAILVTLIILQVGLIKRNIPFKTRELLGQLIRNLIYNVQIHEVNIILYSTASRRATKFKAIFSKLTVPLLLNRRSIELSFRGWVDPVLNLIHLEKCLKSKFSESNPRLCY